MPGSSILRRALGAGAVALLAVTAGPVALAAAADEPVVVRDAQWHIRNGPTFGYGRPTDVQVMGDWDDDGDTTPGVFRDGTWHLRNSRSAGGADVVVGFGRAGDVPVVGDWDGDGRTGIGVVRGSTWYLRSTLASGPAELTFPFGRAGDIPVTGDWNDDGRAGVGVVRGGTWHLRNGLSAGPAESTFTYGRAGDVPVTGDWDGDGRTGVGIVRQNTWHLRQVASAGTAHAQFPYGRCGDTFLAGRSARTIPGVPTSVRGTEWTTLPTSQRVVALTFDAGGNAAGLSSILDTLARTGTAASFFLTGAWTDANPSSARQVAHRYPVGNHSYNHPDFTAISDAAGRDQVVRTDQTVRAVTGHGAHPWFRFPFGARDDRTIALVNCLGYGSVRWTVDTLGWRGTSGGQSATTVRNRVLDTLRPGQIVLMHVGSNPDDGSTLDADALPSIIDAVRARGYRFVSLADYG